MKLQQAVDQYVSHKRSLACSVRGWPASYEPFAKPAEMSTSMK
jgi:hypothetical protein